MFHVRPKDANNPFSFLAIFTHIHAGNAQVIHISITMNATHFWLAPDIGILTWTMRAQPLMKASLPGP